HRASAEDQEIVGVQRAAAESLDAPGDSLLEPAQILVLIPERLARLAATFPDPVGELNELVDGLLAVQSHDVVGYQLAGLAVRFIRTARQHFQKHGHHDLGPSLSNQ